MTAANLAAATHVAIVADRTHLEDLRQLARREFTGGHWLTTVETWARLPSMPYLVLWADGRRLRARAPLAVLAADTVALAKAVDACCQWMSDVTCAWMTFCDGDALETVRAVTLADCEPRGRA